MGKNCRVVTQHRLMRACKPALRALIIVCSNHLQTIRIKVYSQLIKVEEMCLDGSNWYKIF